MAGRQQRKINISTAQRKSLRAFVTMQQQEKQRQREQQRQRQRELAPRNLSNTSTSSTNPIATPQQRPPRPTRTQSQADSQLNASKQRVSNPDEASAHNATGAGRSIQSQQRPQQSTTANNAIATPAQHTQSHSNASNRRPRVRKREEVSPRNATGAGQPMQPQQSSPRRHIYGHGRIDHKHTEYAAGTSPIKSPAKKRRKFAPTSRRTLYNDIPEAADTPQMNDTSNPYLVATYNRPPKSGTKTRMRYSLSPQARREHERRGQEKRDRDRATGKSPQPSFINVHHDENSDDYVMLSAPDPNPNAQQLPQRAQNQDAVPNAVSQSDTVSRNQHKPAITEQSTIQSVNQAVQSLSVNPQEAPEEKDEEEIRPAVCTSHGKEENDDDDDDDDDDIVIQDMNVTATMTESKKKTNSKKSTRSVKKKKQPTKQLTIPEVAGKYMQRTSSTTDVQQQDYFDLACSIPLPSVEQSVDSVEIEEQHNKNVKTITVNDRSLMLENKVKNKFSENDAKANDDNDEFEMKVVETAPSSLQLDDGKYNKVNIKKKLMLQEWCLTSCRRGSSRGWRVFHSIINDKNQLVNRWAFCWKCVTLYYKGTSTSNLNSHYDSFHAEDTNNNKNDENDEEPSNNQDVSAANQKTSFVPLNNATKQDVRTNSTFAVASTYSAFTFIEEPEVVAWAQSLINCGAKHGRIDAAKVLPTASRVRTTVIKEAKKVRSTTRDILKKICSTNVLPPICCVLDLYGDKHLQRCHLGITMMVVVDFKLRELSLGVIPFDSIAEYESKFLPVADEDEQDYEDFIQSELDEFLEEWGDDEYKQVRFVDADGNETSIKIKGKNWKNIKLALLRIWRQYGIHSRASDIFPIPSVSDKGSNIKKALEQALNAEGYLCFGHRFSTTTKTSVQQLRDSTKSADTMFKNVSKTVEIVNKSSWRDKMDPSLKPSVKTRFWTTHTMLESYGSNYEKIRAWSVEQKHTNLMKTTKGVIESLLYPLSNMKSLIKQSEYRKRPTLQLLMNGITRYYNYVCQHDDNDRSYSKILKANLKRNIRRIVIPDIKDIHLMASYLCLPTRDIVWIFDNAPADVWNGQERRDEMMKVLISKFKQYKTRWQSFNEKQQRPKKKGRKKRKELAETTFDIYALSGNDQTTTTNEIEAEESESEEEDNDEQIPREIRWYNAFKISSLTEEKRRAYMEDPLLFFREHQKQIPRLSEIAKAIFVIPLSSAAGEAMFNDNGLILRPQRCCLDTSITEDLDALIKWLRQQRAY